MSADTELDVRLNVSLWSPEAQLRLLHDLHAQLAENSEGLPLDIRLELESAYRWSRRAVERLDAVKAQAEALLGDAEDWE